MPANLRRLSRCSCARWGIFTKSMMIATMWGALTLLRLLSVAAAAVMLVAAVSIVAARLIGAAEPPFLPPLLNDGERVSAVEELLE